MLRSAVILSLLTLALATPASAQTHEAHLEAGFEAFAAADYDRAMTEFLAAQALDDSDVARFNLVRTHEALGDCEKARLGYRSLIARPGIDADVREVASQRLDGLECTSPSVAEATPTEWSPEPDGPPAIGETLPRPRRRSQALPIVGWATLGVGLGIFLAMLVERAANRSRANNGFDAIGADHGCAWSLSGELFFGPRCDADDALADPRYGELNRQWEHSQSRGRVVFPLSYGITAIGIGLVVFAYARPAKPATVSWQLWLGPEGAGAGVRAVWGHRSARP